MKPLFFALLLGVSACSEKPSTVDSSPSPSPEYLPDRIGKSYACKMNVWAAFNVDDAERLAELLQEGDKQAILIMVRRGQLVLVKKGTPAMALTRIEPPALR